MGQLIRLCSFTWPPSELLHNLTLPGALTHFPQHPIREAFPGVYPSFLDGYREQSLTCIGAALGHTKARISASKAGLP